MVWNEVVQCAIAVLLSGVALMALWRYEISVRKCSLRLRADAAELIELRYQEEWHRQLEAVQDIAERVIDSSAATVRNLHMEIAKIPFDTLESWSKTRRPAKIVRQTHDLISESVYGSIRGINKAAGRLTRVTIDARTQRMKSILRSNEDD